MPEYKRMIQRHGTYTELEQSEALPYEFLAVDSGDPNTEDGKALYYQASGELRKRIKTAEEGLPAGSVDTSQLVDGAVTSAKIGTGEVKTTNIDSEAITGAKIASGAVNNSHLANNSVMSANIKDGEVKTVDIDDRAVTAPKIGIGAVQSDNIGVGQVQEANIDGGAVTNNKLATNSVSTLKIQDEAVTEEKLADNSVTNDKILNSTILLPKLASGAVTTSGNSAQAWAFASDYSLPTILLVKSWILNNVENLVKTTDYSIGFNTEGMAVKKTINKTLNIGEFGAETVKVYVSTQVTRIGANFFTTATNVTDIYIDNTEGEVELPTIPEGVTVHYKDEFKLSDLLVNSDIASNTKLLNLENTFNGLINGDEVAY